MFPVMASMSGQEFGLLRESQGVTQGDVAREAGVSARQVWNWEHAEHLSPKIAARAMRALRRAAAIEDAEPEDVEPPPQNLADMSSAALIAQLQQIIGILAARLEDHTPKGETGSESGQTPSEVGDDPDDPPRLLKPSNGGAIRGRLGMPPRTD